MKAVRIAELKARLSAYLRAVRRGETVTILDRETPIARIVPYTGASARLEVRRPGANAPALHDVPLPPPLRVAVDTVALLLEERRAAMIAYADSSVLLRIVLRQPGALKRTARAGPWPAPWSGVECLGPWIASDSRGCRQPGHRGAMTWRTASPPGPAAWRPSSTRHSASTRPGLRPARHRRGLIDSRRQRDARSAAAAQPA